mgnify:CR=1 FL=1
MSIEHSQGKDYSGFTIERQPPVTHHPDLHDPAQEVRLDQIERLVEHPNALHGADPLELRAYVEEIRLLPEYTSYEQDQVQIEFWIEQIHSLLDLDPKQKGYQVGKSTLDLLQDSIEHYAQSVRRFRSAEFAKMRMEPDAWRQFMKNIDTARHHAHEALIASVNAFSRAIHQKIPATLPEDQRAAWELATEKHWFDLGRIKSRSALGSWAIQTEMHEKGEILLQTINTILTEKNQATP